MPLATLFVLHELYSNVIKAVPPFCSCRTLLPLVACVSSTSPSLSLPLSLSLSLSFNSSTISPSVCTLDDDVWFMVSHFIQVYFARLFVSIFAQWFFVTWCAFFCFCFCFCLFRVGSLFLFMYLAAIYPSHQSKCFIDFRIMYAQCVKYLLIHLKHKCELWVFVQQLALDELDKVFHRFLFSSLELFSQKLHTVEWNHWTFLSSAQYAPVFNFSARYTFHKIMKCQLQWWWSLVAIIVSHRASNELEIAISPSFCSWLSLWNIVRTDFWLAHSQNITWFLVYYNCVCYNLPANLIVYSDPLVHII